MKDPKINVERSILDVVLESFAGSLKRLKMEGIIYNYEIIQHMIRVQPTFSVRPIFEWELNIKEDL